MSTVGDKIKEACRRDKIPLAVACDKSGVNYKTLHAQISNNRAIPFETIDRISKFFGVPMDFFSAYRPTLAVRAEDENSILHQRAAAAYTAALRSEQIKMMQSGYDIGTDDVLNWLASQNGVLENFDALMERVDLFHPVGGSDEMLRPHRIGKQSLATTFFQLQNEDHYVKTVESFDPKFIDQVLVAHLKASEVKYAISDIDIDVVIGSERIIQSYRRIIAPVTDRNGQQFTLVHAKLI